MILTVDAGNTLIKIGAWEGEELLFVSRLHTDKYKTQDEYTVNILEIFNLNDCLDKAFEGAIIACVVPALSQILKKAIVRVIKSDQVFLVSPGLKTGLNIKIDDPATLGADMVCAGVAAVKKYPMPCIIISLGTATAIFALDENGAFLGGSVSAGAVVSLGALSRNTALLPHISFDIPGKVIGTNTIESLKSGAIFGTAAMIDGMVDRMQPLLGEKPLTVVACGGLARYISCHCAHQMLIDDHLVLEGLKLIFYKNVKH